MFNAKIAEAYVDIYGNTKPLQKDLVSVQNVLRSFIGPAFGVVALKGLFNLGKEMVALQTDFVETQQKFDVVFGGMNTKAEEVAKTFAKSFGLAESTAKELLSTTGDLMVGWGASREEALKLSEKTNRLAADITSLKNIEGGVTEVVKRLNSAMIGQSRAAISLGIALNQREASFQTRVRNRMRETGETHALARAHVVLEEAYRQSVNSIGDYERTQLSVANQQRKASEQTKQFKTYLGQLLTTLFSVNDATEAYASTVERLNEKWKTNSIYIIEAVNNIVAFMGSIAALIALPFEAVWKMVKDIASDIVKLFEFISKAASNAFNGVSFEETKKEWSKMVKGLEDPIMNLEKSWNNFTGTVLASWENAQKKTETYKDSLKKVNKEIAGTADAAKTAEKALKMAYGTASDIRKFAQEGIESDSSAKEKLIEEEKNAQVDINESMSEARKKAREEDIKAWESITDKAKDITKEAKFIFDEITKFDNMFVLKNKNVPFNFEDNDKVFQAEFDKNAKIIQEMYQESLKGKYILTNEKGQTYEQALKDTKQDNEGIGFYKGLGLGAAVNVVADLIKVLTHTNRLLESNEEKPEPVVI